MPDRMPIATSECPDESQLTSFCAGKIPGAQFESLAAHVENCPECGRWVESHLSDDSVATMFRKPDPFAQYASEVADKPWRVRAAPADSAYTARGPSNPGQLPIKPARRPPTKLGSYRVVDLLGRGGMAEVYKAFDETLGCAVAIKIPHPESNDVMVARFSHEVKAIGSLDHPNIVRARAAGEQDGIHYLVMDFVDGIDLKWLVQAGGPVSSGKACEMVAQAAAGLQAIHERGLVHRDLKPSNLMVDKAGTVKVLDLGLVQWNIGDLQALTRNQDLMGTVDYMAPEQAADPHAADIRADIYSLGCTLFELLAGRPPFSGPKFANMTAKLLGHSAADRPSVRAVNSLIPEGVDAVVQKAMAMKPEDRFATPAEFRVALLDLNEETALSLAGSVLTTAPAPRKVNRRRWLAWSVGGTAAATLGVLGWVRDLFRGPDSPPSWARELEIVPYPGKVQESGFTWDSKSKSVSIAPRGWCLLKLGRVEPTHHRVVIEFDVPLQHSIIWGFYFGYRTVTIQSSERAEFQLLEFAHNGADNELTRNWTFMNPRDQHPKTVTPSKSPHQPVAARIEAPRAGTNRLEIAFESQRIKTIRWNTAVIGELTSEKATAEFETSDHLGSWGVMTNENMWIKSITIE